MVLDIDQFRTEKGGNPEKIKENQKKRFCDDSKFKAFTILYGMVW